MNPAKILICTVGTSLFWPNLEGLKKALADGTVAMDRKALAEAYERRDWHTVADELVKIADHDENDRLLGAEINSIVSLIDKGHADKDCGLFFLHSETESGRDIAAVLTSYYGRRGHAPVEAVEVTDLTDQDPSRFRTRGLRNLARELCRIIRERSAAAYAINATGGYKAQIAIGVLLGQALSVPVYYKHERFSEIISFPPMPVSLDFDVWMEASGMLQDLSRNPEPAPFHLYEDEWQEEYEALVERISIDGQEYLELSATGQIFWETFRDRFHHIREQVLPPPVPASKKKKPHLEKSGWPGQHPEVENWLHRITQEVPQVARCASFFYSPDLAERTRFRLSPDGIEGILSNGTYTVKFRVDSSAQSANQQKAVVAALNEWLATQSLG